MVLKNRFQKIVMTSLIGASLGLVGCGAEEEEEDGDTVTTDTVPQIQAIDLTGLGNGTSTSLVEDDCDAASSGGIFGLAFGGACHTAPFAENLLLGEDGGDPGGDGTVDCADYDSDNDDSGILMSLLCESFIQQNPNMVSMGFEDDGSAIAASFVDFDSTDTMTAVGAWSAGNSDSFPANIRMWSGTTLSDLTGIVGIKLSDLQNGTIYFDSTPFTSTGEQAIQVQVDFSAKDDASNCATSPSTDNCHWQEIRLYAGETLTTNGPPNGFHLRILANDVDAPTFMVLEGRYRYAENPNFGNGMSDTRQIYYQVVENNDVVWGTFAFLDANGDAISTGNTFVDAFLTSLASDGICSDDLVTDANNNSQAKTCTELGVDASVWTDLFTGQTDFTNITESPVPDIFSTGAPTESGITTL
ncbi:hypothetical protein [Pseudobacteriovorax antillogorgiicola]|uniref:Uncharacterized protein n=1 Tax=Pseudobacteriovorax antillogorgiicola TaxID=1513793 RepID=A0A1Y6CW10_9BACT|nr:hypothetical protein [Pseudobacteriovorax antillogorgiicola]TCS42850.1 hypothetical protein EDD56_13916 [Pseudobacteriovorax antillogorgiicola]SMF81852.1 hypothetical protein SAMN06296036_13814 [Pseudobacteriovorax antillogorgiicola]